MAILVESDLSLPRDPTSALHAATKQYVDNLVTGLSPKQSVRAATTANITIATALNSGDSIDGVTLANGDRVLVKNQSAPAENGIYVVAASPARATDMDAWTEVPGAAVFIEEGSTQADTLWVSTADAGGTLNTTAITWTQFSSVQELIAGAGIGKTGVTLSVAAGTGMSQDADGLSIDTAIVPRKAVANTFTQPQTIDLGATGTALTLDIHAGGDTWIQFTEAGSLRATLAETVDRLYLSTQQEFIIGTVAGDITLGPAGNVSFSGKRGTNFADPAAAQDAATRAFVGHPVSAAITGDGSTTTFTVTHNLNTRDVIAAVRANSGNYDYKLIEIRATTVNTVDVIFAVAPANLAAYRCTVIGIQG